MNWGGVHDTAIDEEVGARVRELSSCGTPIKDAAVKDAVSYRSQNLLSVTMAMLLCALGSTGAPGVQRLPQSMSLPVSPVSSVASGATSCCCLVKHLITSWLSMSELSSVSP